MKKPLSPNTELKKRPLSRPKQVMSSKQVTKVKDCNNLHVEN